MRMLRQSLSIIAALALWLATCGAAAAQTCAAYPFTFTPNTTIQSSQVNSNFATIRNCANNSLAPLSTPTFIGPVTITTTPLGVPSGGTGAATAAAALSSLGALPTAGGSMTGAINESFATIASAATTNIGAAAANYLQVTGTTTITAFDTIQAGTERTLEFAGALQLTNSANLILGGGGNYTTAAGDVLKFRSEGAGKWRQVSLLKASGLPGINTQQFFANGTFTTPANTNTNTTFKFTVVGGGGAGGSPNAAGVGAGGAGGGATAIFYGSGVAAVTNVTVTIGAGGTANAAAAGNAGGNSSIVFNATTVTANGGGGGPFTGSSSAGGIGGTASNGTINIQGQGGTASYASSGIGGTGGGGTLGGGGPGGNGGGGQPGGNYGGGGGGGGNGTFSGGAGAPGIVIVEWVQ